MNDNEDDEFYKKIKFSSLCKFFEKISVSPEHKKKKQLVNDLFSKLRPHSLYPIIRLLLPQLDKERQTYGLKEKKIGVFYIKALTLSPNGEDAKCILNWKKPQKNMKNGGDFGDVIFSIMSKRSLIKNGDYSLYDVNKLLDELNLSESDEKVKIITTIIRKFSALEQKWLIRIILKDLKIGISDKLVLTQYHIDAIEYLNVSSNLKLLCEELKDPNSRYSHKSISLFTPIRPMLASRHVPNKIAQIFSGREFVIEEKLDGERIQIHKKGDQVKLFTRNSNDASTIYESFIPIVKKHIISDNVIIDGELLIWDSILGRKEPFGKLKTFAALTNSNEEEDGLNYGKNYLYVAFDILYYKGEPIMSLPYRERHNILKKCIDVKENVIEIIKQVKGSQLSDIINALDIAVELRQEGIMIKDLESMYVPNERKEKWIKLKPEYIDGIGDDLDLIIMGGYYGTGYRKGGTISQFLLGVKKSDKLFYSMCRVGSGFTDSELKSIQTMLKSYWKPFDLNRPPDCFRFHNYTLKDKPDVWIHPTHSKIIQVKASQIIPTDKYMAGYTLRFPRIVKLRTDKSWNECMDYNEFIEMARQSEGFLSKRKYNQSTGECSLNVKRRKTSSKSYKEVINVIETVKIESELFKGLKFCVLGGDEELTKQEVEKLIQTHSGDVVPLPTDDIVGVISSKKTIRVSNIINKGDIDVILVKWIKSCISNKRIISIEPRHVLYAKKETRERFEKDLDKYGDSYETDTQYDALKEIFQTMNHNQMDNNITTDIVKLDYKTLNVPWWGLFRGKLMYLDQYSKVNDETSKINLSSFEILEKMIHFYGGKTYHHITPSITEIILDSNDLSRLNEIKKVVKWIKLDCAIISKEWIIHSINEKELNDYDDFIIR